MLYKDNKHKLKKQKGYCNIPLGLGEKKKEKEKKGRPFLVLINYFFEQ